MRIKNNDKKGMEPRHSGAGTDDAIRMDTRMIRTKPIITDNVDKISDYKSNQFNQCSIT